LSPQHFPNAERPYATASERFLPLMKYSPPELTRGNAPNNSACRNLPHLPGHYRMMQIEFRILKNGYE
jgi:hypothetical protein